MKRNCSLEEISDGRLYESNDLVEASCNGCKGHAACCHGMGNSIILDPYDIYRLTTNLNVTVPELLADRIQLNVVDGIILPNLAMTGQAEHCAFLNEQGRCGIHGFRPGICRIFPLGRVYENGDFKYFLQVEECTNQSNTKVRVSKWIDTPDLAKNHQFLVQWHYFLNEMEQLIKVSNDDVVIKNLNMYLLNSFYLMPYDSQADFYTQFKQRLDQVRNYLKMN